MSQVDLPIEPHETLFVPKRRRFVHRYVQTPAGNTELVIYFGVKEISFDEPELFPFGEGLFKHDRFVAESAMTWAKDTPYGWDRVKGLLEALLAEGIVSRLEPDANPPPVQESARHRAFLEAEAARKAPTEPLWWNPDCAQVLEAVAGRPLELGYMETVVPVHRLAHPAFDAEGRHVGEINAFPNAMRMKLPTDWRICKYPGGRYEDDLPMNMTALNAMRKHWRSMLKGVLLVREELLCRYPLRPDGVWKLGDLHALGCAILALPTLLLMRGKNPVPNGELDPVLSSMFRVSDGVRMVASYTLFFLEDPRPYDSPMSAAELLHITEARDHFHSNRGVCAGPPMMVDEFFATMIDGRPLTGEVPVLGDWVHQIPTAVDYALYGLALYALIFALWGRMAHAWEKIRIAMLNAGSAGGNATLERMRDRIERDWTTILPSHQDRAEQRAWSEARYIEMFDRAQRGFRDFDENISKVESLSELLRPAPRLLAASAKDAVRDALHACVGLVRPSAALDHVAAAVVEYLRVERTVLGAVVAIQQRINALLERPHPERPLCGADLAIHHTLRVGTPGALPYVMHSFRDVLGLDVDNTAHSTRLRYASTTIELV